MPFKSEKQRRWMWANNPAMARRWEDEENESVQKEGRKMKVTHRQLRRLIREERATLLREFGPQGTGGASLLIDFAHAWAKLGGMVQEQIEELVTTYVNSGGYAGTWENDAFYDAVHRIRPEALSAADFRLRPILKIMATQARGHTPVDDILEALDQAQMILEDQTETELPPPLERAPRLSREAEEVWQRK
jgi:hypothetical protein